LAVTNALPLPIVVSACRAVCTVVADALKAMALVVWPLKVKVKVPPVRLTAWTLSPA
jgi:hypothetical protein